MLTALSGAPGLGILVAACLVAVVLEVLDERVASPAATAPAGESRRRRGWGRVALQAALVLLVLGTIAATGVRIFVVVR